MVFTKELYSFRAQLKFFAMGALAKARRYVKL